MVNISLFLLGIYLTLWPPDFLNLIDIPDPFENLFKNCSESGSEGRFLFSLLWLRFTIIILIQRNSWFLLLSTFFNTKLLQLSFELLITIYLVLDVVLIDLKIWRYLGKSLFDCRKLDFLLFLFPDNLYFMDGLSLQLNILGTHLQLWLLLSQIANVSQTSNNTLIDIGKVNVLRILIMILRFKVVLNYLVLHA